MPKGGTLRARTSLRRKPSPRVLVEIADTGCGIPQADLTRVFSPFYSTKIGAGGTGLGLAVCQRIMLRHGGHIEVESRVGRGTSFILHFPPSRARP
jgi:signal transduction histidine kinase